MMIPPGVADRDWLAWRWQMTIAERFMAGTTTFLVQAAGCDVHACSSRDEAERWAAAAKPSTLAELMEAWPGEGEPLALIEGVGTGGRLARIPSRLWSTYDGMLVFSAADRLTILSAKARAMFPSERAVFVRVKRQQTRGA